MGAVIIGKNVNAQSFSMGINVPVMDGLLGVWFGGSKGLWVNQVAGGAPSTLVGNPVHVTEYSSRMDINNYVDTNIRETANMTQLVISKIYAPTTAGVRLPLFTNFNNVITDGGVSVTAQGSGLVFEPAGTQQMVGASYSGVAGSASNANVAVLAAESGLPTSLAAADDTWWRAMLGKIDGTGVSGPAGNRYVKNLTKGTQASQALVSGNVRDLRNTATQRIGTRGPSGTTVATTEVMLAMLWDRALTNAEEASMYAYVQSYAGRRGITI
ncbi:hypothetical protein M4789_10205 [Klebsiella pneumoniae subsp. pneumoniae]|uniref:hypothetical protein n=1 Tax=Klebsiella pneumoniae TaxID=573 RepID=UPI00217EBF1F|nr:hypothetical protein [Klebsiella pneumoniae]MCS6696831.1 hypothetical protein [Klebsiella pneumoniae subsp. pneumoniae]